MKRFDRLNVILELAIILINITTIIVAISKYNSAVQVSAKENITISEFPISFTEFSPSPLYITSGSDGNLWFTEPNIQKIGRIATNGTVTEFPSEIGVWDIVSDPDGNLWFTGASNKIGRIATNGTVTEFPLPENLNWIRPMHITSGSDENIWFSVYKAYGVGTIGRMTPNGDVTVFPLSSTDKIPGDLVSGSDGNIWFIEEGTVSPQIDMIAKITPEGEITEFPLPSSRYPMAITSGTDGNVWFTEGNLDGSVLSGWIAKITPEGIITEYSLPRSSQVYGISLQGIVKGQDGNMWFTEGEMNKIGMITPDGKIIEYAIPTDNSGAWDITSGPDGNIWFTELFANKIGRVNLTDVKEPPGQSKDDAILSPFNNGVTWSVFNGYLDNRDQSWAGCGIGFRPLDHCRNQLFGLDMIPDQQSDTQVLAPANGTIKFKGQLEGGCLGLRIKLDNGLNMNVCHFATLNVDVGKHVLRGEVLGTRNTRHVHLSLDDRYGSGNLCPEPEKCHIPVPFSGKITFEGISFDPNPNGETVILPYPKCDKNKVVCQFNVDFQQYKGFTGTSTNRAIQ